MGTTDSKPSQSRKSKRKQQVAPDLKGQESTYDIIPIKDSRKCVLHRFLSALCFCCRKTSRIYFPSSVDMDLVVQPHSTKKTLVLDLDETLVHSSFEYMKNHDFTLQVIVDAQETTAYVMTRPGVSELLAAAAPDYEIIVFTASLSVYADPLLTLLDPQGFISTRLFRESCDMQDGNWVKNLTKLGRDMSKVVIVDAFNLHRENAIPITSFFDDKGDRELFKLIPVLKELAKAEDVRKTLTKWGKV